MCEHKCSVVQSRPTLCDLMDCGPPSSSGIFQIRILKWASSYFSRGFSQSRDGICVSVSPALQVDSLPLSHWKSRK